VDTNRLKRTWYVVRPVGGQWEVAFGGERGHFLFATRAHAEQIARDAAHLHHYNRNEPAGARVDLPGEDPHVLATYGRLPQLERRRASS
jgi:hypothetical protein